MPGASSIQLAEYNAPDMPPQQRLCRSVIYQAFIDANRRARPIPADANYLKRREMQAEANDRAAAIAWFRDAGPDFQLVCDLADVDAGRVQSNALSMLGFTTRETANV